MFLQMWTGTQNLETTQKKCFQCGKADDVDDRELGGLRCFCVRENASAVK